MLATCAFNSLKRRCFSLANATNNNFLSRACNIIASILAALIFGFVTSAILTDATYRVMFGNHRPTADVLLVDFETTCSNVVAQFQYEPLGVTCRAIFAFICVAGSVYLYAYPPRSRQEKRHNHEPERGHYETVTNGDTVKLGKMVPPHEEAESLLPTHSIRRGSVDHKESQPKVGLLLMGIL